MFVMMLCIGLVAGLGQTGAIQTSGDVVNGVYYSGDKSGNNVSLMINVYWGDEYLDDMLDILKQKGVNATFFIGGSWAVDNEERILQIAQDGHELANHGYSHKDCDKLSAEHVREEIAKTHEIVKSYTGKEMTLFMPASGAYNKQVVKVANEENYQVVMWSKDTIDWRDQDSDLIYTRATKNCGGGDLILMHPTAKTRDSLAKIIDYYQNNGLNLTTVSKNLNFS